MRLCCLRDAAYLFPVIPKPLNNTDSFSGQISIFLHVSLTLLASSSFESIYILVVQIVICFLRKQNFTRNY